MSEQKPNNSSVQEGHGLEVPQRVRVDRGNLAGLTGVLVSVRGDRCLIKLDAKPQVVLLLIDAAAVKALPRTAPDS